METIFDLERWNFDSNYDYIYLILEKKIVKKYANFHSFFLAYKTSL